MILQLQFYTHAHPSCTIHSIKTRHLILSTSPYHMFSPPSITHHLQTFAGLTHSSVPQQSHGVMCHMTRGLLRVQFPRLVWIGMHTHVFFWLSWKYWSDLTLAGTLKICYMYRIHIFYLKIINPQNIHKNILEISDQNRVNIEVTLLYFSTNQLKTQKKRTFCKIWLRN